MLRWLDHIWTKRALCATTCAAALAAALASLSWRMLHDTPIMLYLADMTVNHGAIPYRDFFDMNLPGSQWVFELIVRLFGVSDFAVHLSNAFVVAVISGFVFFAFSKSCRRCAFLGAGLGALRIFSGEWSFVLQRELLALIPIAGLFVLALRDVRYPLLKSIIAGLLLAWLMLIKPQLAMYGTPFVILFWIEGKNWRNRFCFFARMGTAFCIPLLVFILWLAQNSAWGAFKDTVTYWTLYGQMTGGYSFVDAATQGCNILSSILKMICSPYTVAACLGLVVGQRNSILSKKQASLLGGVLVLSIVIPAMSGQFWSYHCIPFYYLTLASSGFILSGRKHIALLSVALTLFWFGFTGMRVYRETTASSVERVKYNVPDTFANYLRCHAAPNDCAQPIDWTGGALHGMLIADVRLATRFPYSFYFFHSVHHPLIQKIRKEFLDNLAENKPRFLLESISTPMPSGLDTEEHFQAFENWRDAHYRVVQQNEHYRIWERNAK